MTTKTAVPYFGNPPREYNQRYQADVQRAFGQFVREMMNPGEARATKIVLTDLQQDDVGLEAGTVYLNGNTLKISLLDISACAGSAASTTVGIVQVNIT